MDDTPEAGKLFDAIEERAAQERAAISAEAEARAAEISAAAAAEIARLKTEAMAGLEKTLVSDAQRLLGEARLQGRWEALRMKRKLIDEAFTAAGREIEGLCASAESERAFAALGAEATAAVGEPCALETSRESGTVAAVSADGRRRADNSPRTRLARVRSIHESEVARLLFGEPAKNA
jgi:vacuolar-type H+-ATPase subunit E/Vma4